MRTRPRQWRAAAKPGRDRKIVVRSAFVRPRRPRGPTPEKSRAATNGADRIGASQDRRKFLRFAAGFIQEFRNLTLRAIPNRSRPERLPDAGRIREFRYFL